MATIRDAVPERVALGILNILEFQCSDENHFTDKYKCIRAVDGGSMGEVYKVKCLDTGHEYAIKLVKIAHPGSDKNIYNMFCQVLQECGFSNVVGSHPNLIQAYPKLNWIVLPAHLDAAEDIITILDMGLDLPLDFLGRFAGTKVYMVFEWYTQDLLSLMEETQQAVQSNQQTVAIANEQSSKKVLCDVLLGLRYLHQMGVVHSDFKPNNVLVLYNPQLHYIHDQLHAVISDMGHAQHLGNRKATSMKRMMKTVYDAPDHRLSVKADIWSFGLLAFHLTSVTVNNSCVLPHDFDFLHHLAGKKKLSFLRDSLRLRLSGQCQFFIESIVQCLHIVPELRPSAEVLFHVVSGEELFKEVCVAARALHRHLDPLMPEQYIEEIIFPQWYRNKFLIAIENITEFTQETKSRLQAFEIGHVFPLSAAMAYFDNCPIKLKLIAQALAGCLPPSVVEITVSQ